MIKKEQKYFYNVVLSDDLEYVPDDKTQKGNILEEPKTGILSTFEKEIYDKFLKEGYKVMDISQSMNCNVKKIYNAISRIRTKLSSYNIKDEKKDE